MNLIGGWGTLGIMKLDQLTYFVEAAKHEHIGRAAKILAISPSAISHSISALEEELGRNLFEKRGKKIHLTTHGKLLMERAHRLLREVEGIRAEIHSDQVEARGHYKIAATHWLCSQVLTPGWTKIQNPNPRLTCEIYSLRSAHVVGAVAQGELDLGICFSPQSHPDLQLQPLYTGQLIVGVAKGHPLLRKKAVGRIEALSHFTAVLPKAFHGIDVCESHPVFDRYSIQVTPDCLVDNYEVAVEKVANSNSWGFFPDLVLKRFPHLRAVPLPTDWDAPYEVSAIWPRTRPLTPVLQKLVEEARNTLSR